MQSYNDIIEIIKENSPLAKIENDALKELLLRQLVAALISLIGDKHIRLQNIDRRSYTSLIKHGKELINLLDNSFSLNFEMFINTYEQFKKDLITTYNSIKLSSDSEQTTNWAETHVQDKIKIVLGYFIGFCYQNDLLPFYDLQKYEGSLTKGFTELLSTISNPTQAVANYQLEKKRQAHRVEMYFHINLLAYHPENFNELSFLETIAKFPEVHFIEIGDPLSKEALEKLFDVLEKQTTINTLAINASLSTATLDLFDLLKRSAFLKALSIDEPIDDKHMKYLLECLELNTHLRDLQLMYCELSEQVLEQVANFVSKNKTLENLTIHYKPIKDDLEMLEKFLLAYKKNYTLISLLLYLTSSRDEYQDNQKEKKRSNILDNIVLINNQRDPHNEYNRIYINEVAAKVLKEVGTADTSKRYNLGEDVGRLIGSFLTFADAKNLALVKKGHFEAKQKMQNKRKLDEADTDKQSIKRKRK